MKLNEAKKYGAKIKKYDLPFLVVTILLIAFGFIAVLSASYPTGLKDNGDGYFFVKKNIKFLILGTFLMFLAARMPRKTLKKLTPYVFWSSIILIALLWTPFGQERYGQVRWVKIPNLPQIQPSDFIKVSIVLMLANILEKNYKRLSNTNVFITIIFIMVIGVMPILLKDFSTGLVVVAEVVSMILVAGLYFYQFVILGGMGITGLLILVFSVGYRRRRVMAFFKGTSTGVKKDNYQITQALYAIAMGGTSGVGLFHSRQKYANLPFAYNDFIYAIICEEFGAIGGIILILLFAFFVYRGYCIAYRTKNIFDKLTAVGLTTFIGIQAIFNIGVNINLFPVTGITLPFISYGGTALLISMISAGLILRISREN